MFSSYIYQAYMTVVEDGGDDKYIFDHEIADLEKHYILYRLYIWSI